MRRHTRKLRRLINGHIDTKKPFTGAEVGVWRGQNAEGLLEWFSQLSLTLVDPYTEPGFRTDISSERAEEEAHSQVHLFGQRANFVKDTSVNASKMFPDNHFDFVFIDGNHYYEHVIQDLNSWWPKVKQGGLIMTHDYGSLLDTKGVLGVTKAVVEFSWYLEKHHPTMTPGGYVWAMQKAAL